MNYRIDDVNGNQLVTGLTELEARQAAQRIANERDEPVWYFRVFRNGTTERASKVEPTDESWSPGDWYVAIGTDGTRAVVWGLGVTAREAVADALSQDLGGADRLRACELRSVKIDGARALRVDAGDVDAEDL